MVTEVRASTLSRIMNCLGPVSLQLLAENVEGEPARQGTAIGELLTAMIQQKTDRPNFGRTASNGFFIDNEMHYHARDVYQQMLVDAQGAEITSEIRVDWKTPSGIVIRGQYDGSYILGTTLNVDDLKYGFAIHEVHEHWQTIAYAIGIALRTPGLTHVRFTIRQPRAYHPDGPVRSKTITIDELWQYYYRIINRMAELAEGKKTLSTSEKCKYCAGVNNCPALHRASSRAVDFVMEDWNEKELTGEDISKLLKMFDRAVDLIEIKHKSLKELAISRLKKNEIIDGYDYEPKYGDRAWKPGVTAETLTIMSNGVNALTTPKIMSPSQAEIAGIPKKLIAQLCFKPLKGVDLVKKNTLAEAQKVFQKPS